MNEDLHEAQEHKGVINLTNFVHGADKEHPVEIDVIVNEHGKVVVFHSHEFSETIGWFECDLDERKLRFVFDNGANIDSGIQVNDRMQKYMQNSHQILTVLLDYETGDATDGHYYPLILHKA
ncbi:MAG: hypothetical protein KDI46_10070 [Alphaproteobacteria bacterium]|nr:hypothetical protein [Alphaproteobacteria bacterium]